MNIEEIRKKYKSILGEDIPKENNNSESDSNDEQKSEREWINIVRKQKQKRILTESSVNREHHLHAEKQSKKTTVTPKKTTTKLSTQQIIIDLKQKLAQSLLNGTRKDAQIEEFQHLVLKKNEEIKLNQKSINELKNIIQQKDSLLFEEKLKQETLQKQINLRDNSIQELRVQNQLLKKHIENYSKELQSVHLKFQEQRKHFEKVQREKEKIDNLKGKVQKLKDDVKRLQFLLSDSQGYAPIMIALQGKHFLGKPSKQTKELQYWYPDALINGVEKFLKKEQVGHGNKSYTENLVKFIYGLLQRSEKTAENKVKHKYTSRVKQIQRRKNQILSAYEMDSRNDTKKISSVNSRLNASSLRKTTPLNASSQLKSRDFSICLQKSLCFDKQTLSTAKNTTIQESKVDKRKSFIIEGLERSVRMSQNHKKQVIMELIESFCKGIEKLFKLDNKTLVEQKVSALSDWLKESIEQIYESNKLMNEDACNQTGKWKTVAEF